MTQPVFEMFLGYSSVPHKMESSSSGTATQLTRLGFCLLILRRGGTCLSLNLGFTMNRHTSPELFLSATQVFYPLESALCPKTDALRFNY